MLVWVKYKDIILEDAIFIHQIRYDLLQLIWVYQNVGAMHLKDIPPTNLITHRIQPHEKTKIHNAKYKKLLKDYEWWLYCIIEKSMDTRIYEKMVFANGYLSKWNANLVFIPKSSQEQP